MSFSSRSFEVMRRYIAAHGNPIGDQWEMLFVLRAEAYEAMDAGDTQPDVRLFGLLGALDTDALDRIEAEVVSSGLHPDRDPHGCELTYAFLRPTADLSLVRRFGRFTEEQWRDIYGPRDLYGALTGEDADDDDPGAVLSESALLEGTELGSCRCEAHQSIVRLLAICRVNGGLLPDDCNELQQLLDEHDWDESPRPGLDFLLCDLRLIPPWSVESVADEAVALQAYD